MFLSNKPTSRLTTAAKARLNTHTHKLDTIESRKRSPDGSGPPSPSEVIVFNNTHHSGNGGRNNHPPRSLPEVPQVDEINRFLRDTWDRKMHEVKTQNLSILWISGDDNVSKDRDGYPHQHQGSNQFNQKSRNSPQHSARK